MLTAYELAEVKESVAGATARALSPWADRAGAAAYCQCSPSEIDRAADAGVFKRYKRAGTPMFKKAELDAALENGTWLKRKKKDEPAEVRQAA